MKLSVTLFLTDILPKRRRISNKIVKNKIIGKTDISDVYSQLKKSGVEGIELFLPSRVNTAEIQEVKELLDKNDIKVLSVHPPLRFFTQTTLSELSELFEIALLLSAKVIVLHIQQAGFQIFSEKYIAGIQELQNKYRIKIGVENRERLAGSRLKPHSWDEYKFADLMKKNNLNITLDTTHLAQAGGNIINFFKNNKERIVNIHLSDYKAHFLHTTILPVHDRHLPLGKGNLPIVEFLNTLRKEKYQGMVTLEVHSDLEGILDCIKIINSSS